jgi:hypothetical protein
MRPHAGLIAPLRVESDIQLGWNVLIVTKSSINAAGEAQAAVKVAESFFVVVTNPSTYHHHGQFLSSYDFSTVPSYRVPTRHVSKSFNAVSHFSSDALMEKPVAIRAVFEALASLQNRTIVSFGDSVERNIVNDVYSICQHLSGIFACTKMPNVAEPGRAVHIFWPSINLNWITISFPGVSFCLNPN